MIYNIVKETIKDFCLEFLQSPYLCYTEHGLHALFYCRLYLNIPENKRYIQWDETKVCIIQKEYPTADKLGKSKRQHWDISILQSPPQSIPNKTHPYDYLKLYSAIEFGMNADKDHLQEDIRRLSHPNSYVENKYIVHLYRISGPKPKISNRDWSPRSKKILKPNAISNLIKGTDIKIYFVVVDITGNHKSGLWLIDKKGIIKIK